MGEIISGQKSDVTITYPLNTKHLKPVSLHLTFAFLLQLLYFSLFTSPPIFGLFCLLAKELKGVNSLTGDKTNMGGTEQLYSNNPSISLRLDSSPQRGAAFNL